MAFDVNDIVQVLPAALFHPGEVGAVTEVDGDDGNQVVTVLLPSPFGGYDHVKFHSSQLRLVRKGGLTAAAKGFGVHQISLNSLVNSDVAESASSPMQPQFMGGSVLDVSDTETAAKAPPRKSSNTPKVRGRAASKGKGRGASKGQ